MKTSALIFFLFFCFATVSVAQKKDSVSLKDTSKVFVIKDSPPASIKRKFLSVVDGREHYGYRIKGRPNPRNIIHVAVLKDGDAANKYGKLGLNGVLVITTKKYAIRTYQEKLSGLSQKYKKYLVENNGSEDNLSYVIDGLALEMKSVDTIMKLYGLAPDSIKTVDIMKNTFRNGNPQKEIVVITTKH